MTKLKIVNEVVIFSKFAKKLIRRIICSKDKNIENIIKKEILKYYVVMSDRFRYKLITSILLRSVLFFTDCVNIHIVLLSDRYYL